MNLLEREKKDDPVLRGILRACKEVESPSTGPGIGPLDFEDGPNAHQPDDPALEEFRRTFWQNRA